MSGMARLRRGREIKIEAVRRAVGALPSLWIATGVWPDKQEQPPQFAAAFVFHPAHAPRHPRLPPLLAKPSLTPTTRTAAPPFTTLAVCVGSLYCPPCESQQILYGGVSHEE